MFLPTTHLEYPRVGWSLLDEVLLVLYQLDYFLQCILAALATAARKYLTPCLYPPRINIPSQANQQLQNHGILIFLSDQSFKALLYCLSYLAILWFGKSYVFFAIIRTDFFRHLKAKYASSETICQEEKSEENVLSKCGH